MTTLLITAIVVMALAVLVVVVFVSSVLAYAIAPLIWMAAHWALEWFLEWRGTVMADQGRRIDESTRRVLERSRDNGRSIREAARDAAVAKSTAQKYLEKKSGTAIELRYDENE